jgi:tetratricopeptide (TPR) repeat protein
MEDAIARRVAEALLPGLGPRVRIGLSRRDTQSLEAYQEYLKGRYFWSRRTESDFRKAITHFERAIAADDRYALAYSGLADCWILLGVWGAGPAVETHGRARDAAARAAAFDDAPGELHASNAFVKWVYDWDWDGAEAEFRKAIASSPGYATAHQWYAYFLVCRRRFDEAITEIRRAQQLDPLSVSIATDVGEIHCWAGRTADAIGYLRAALDLEPNSAQAHNALGMALIAQGRATDALPELEQALALDGSPRMISSLGHGYGAAGRSADARKQEGRLLALSKERYVSPFGFALIHAGLGDVDGAFAFLDRAFEERSDTMAIIEVHPLFAGLRRDARFAALMARVEASRRVGP